MSLFRSIAIASTLAVTLTACAQNPPVAGGADHSAHHPSGATTTASPADRMAKMDAHMKSMREMHERMSRVTTPQERQALMDEHMKLMREGMALMQGMGPGGHGGGMPGMGGMSNMGPMTSMGQMGPAGTPMDMATRQQMMEKRMEMMQSMMQMMMDRMEPTSIKP